MARFLVKRLLSLVPVLLMVAVIVFLILRLVPGDPAEKLSSEWSSPQEIAKVRETMGLDKPIPQQFVIWMGKVVRGDLGRSYFFKVPVADLIKQRLEPTLALGICAVILSVIIAVPLGVAAAFRSGSWIDRAVMGLSVFGFSVPFFILGYILIFVFSVWLGWLPVQGYSRIALGFWPFLKHLILPSAALALVKIALLSRITRTSVLEVLDEDYIRTARAKGLTDREVLVKHALRNAAVPILTIIGVGIGVLIGGAVVTESVFAIPGVGRLTIEAVLGRDFPVIQALILFFSTMCVLVNLLVDIGYAFLDPRIRY